jgi:flagellar protein FlbT
MEATTSATVREMLARSLEAAEADDCYLALKIARRVMRHEEEVLGLPPLPAPRRDLSRNRRTMADAWIKSDG